jgi:hypothetical protein
MNFKKKILTYTIIPLIIFTAAVSYYRFVVISDFMVSYEGECDPEIESCFVDCADDECSEEYYYTEITRHHNEIESLCGEDITDCEAANSCQESEECEILYCDPETDEDACEEINQDNL